MQGSDSEPTLSASQWNNPVCLETTAVTCPKVVIRLDLHITDHRNRCYRLRHRGAAVCERQPAVRLEGSKPEVEELSRHARLATPPCTETDTASGSHADTAKARDRTTTHSALAGVRAVPRSHLASDTDRCTLPAHRQHNHRLSSSACHTPPLPSLLSCACTYTRYSPRRARRLLRATLTRISGSSCFSAIRHDGLPALVPSAGEDRARGDCQPCCPAPAYQEIASAALLTAIRPLLSFVPACYAGAGYARLHRRGRAVVQRLSVASSTVHALSRADVAAPVLTVSPPLSPSLPCCAQRLGMFLLYSAYTRVGKINATVSSSAHIAITPLPTLSRCFH